VRRIVLAYSGGLDTSVILRWLVDRYQASGRLLRRSRPGRGADRARGQSARTGAVKTIVEDLREEFVRDYVFPMLRAGAIYENQYLLGTSIAATADRQAAGRDRQAGERRRGRARRHRQGNDQVRFELTYAALGPS